MKAWLLWCLFAGLTFGRQPSRNLPTGGIPVDVCMESTNALSVYESQAKLLVSEIFAPIGVDLNWHPCLSGNEEWGSETARTPFRIRWAQHPPSTAPAGALAAARPFGSSDHAITLYEIPLQRFLTQYPNAPAVVLAYVLAHELAHVMQGLQHHSASGILKPNWSYREYYLMLSGALTFTPKDVDLIRDGLAAKPQPPW
jgi:hypothetical protein